MINDLTTDALLIEILTEELPPHDLVDKISEPFAKLLLTALSGFTTTATSVTIFATPRRFGLLLTDVNYCEVVQNIKQKGPAINLGLDSNNNPTKALLGFMKSVEVNSWQELIQGDDGYFYAEKRSKIKTLDEILATVIQQSLAKLPISKNMRYGSENYVFARPIHNVMLLFGKQTLSSHTPIMGLIPVNYTFGHRTMSNNQAIIIHHAKDYEAIMQKNGKVIVQFATRKAKIAKQLKSYAAKLSLKLYEQADLLTEVTALTEYPQVLAGTFAANFLHVPQECLILAMATQQKYFALVDNNHKLSNHFLFAANLRSKNPQIVIAGNEKVLSARLSDAQFFYNNDIRRGIYKLNQQLDAVIYHKQLGTQQKRRERLVSIALSINSLFPSTERIDETLITTTATLLKADLAAEMVSEFPELQGVMGKYYALASNLPPIVADAIAEHYYPRFSGDKLPHGTLAVIMALSDKLETLIGIFSIGLIPTGDKDPYALRRAAIGAARILLNYPVNLKELLTKAIDCFIMHNLNVNPEVTTSVYQFILQRLTVYISNNHNFTTNIINALLKSSIYAYHSPAPKRFDHLIAHLHLLTTFSQNPDSQKLIMSNKRLENILTKAPYKNEASATTNTELSQYRFELLSDAAEINLAQFLKNFAIYAIDNPANDFRAINWHDYLLLLLECSKYLDDFFAQVMVLVDDLTVRNNRLTLLRATHKCFSYLCDLSNLG